jgi:para-aminobenzoate synthetase component 1
LISQPIKGTRKRSGHNDDEMRRELAGSEKDRAENVMIVDLVRNDLARNCEPGSVRVEELFGIYTFETVHQMISTITGTLRALEVMNDPNDLTALRDAFPPGSMTGAPKVMAMELIERYEQTRRGLYSGAVGYFDPDGDFDFNVVIRSILYNAANRYVSVQVGGAIVFDSVPEQEYEECLVKADAMLRALKPA